MSGLKKASTIENLRAAAASGRSAPLPVAGGQVPEVAKPLRTSIIFDKDQHRSLKQWALDNDTDVSAVLRALAAELLIDDELAAKVRARLGQ